MLQKFKFPSFWLILLCCLGCGSDQLRVYPVSGKISFDGKPMEGGGSIALIPTGTETGKAAGGIIDEDGNYTLSTYTEGDGSIPGQFRVIITQTAVDEPEATPDGTAPTESVPFLSADKLIPAIYSDFKASPLIVDIKAEKQQGINFDLKRDVAAGNESQPSGG